MILASLAGTVFGIHCYPLNQVWLFFALFGYACIVWVRPKFWIFAIPAVLPVADLAPWSGWLFFEELDLFVLVTIAVGYWKLMSETPSVRMQPVSAMLLAALAISFGVSAYIGLMPLQPVDDNAFSNYLSHYNSIRLLKPFVWALLLLPLLSRSLEGEEVDRFFIPGIVTGLALVSLVSLWERLAFPGLMDFSSDYRITASFPEMHTGGAALDAYLSMTLPFVVYRIIRSRGKLQSAGGVLLLALSTYAVLATFSRGLYLGYALSIAAMGLFAALRLKGRMECRPLLLASLYAVSALICAKIFISGGYRGLFASVLLLGAAFFLGGQGRWRIPVKESVLLTILLGVFCAIAVFVLDKGAYVAFSIALALFLLGFVIHAFDSHRGLGMAFSGFLGMIWGDLLVNWHWGGESALQDGVQVSLLAVALVFVNRRFARPIWSWNRGGASGMMAGFMLIALVIPVLENYYMKYRFHEAESDLHVRTDHWNTVIEIMDADWKTFAFGMGLGKFPETYFWRNRKEGLPGTYQFGEDGDGPYIRLNGSYLGWEGEYLRYGQRVAIQPYRNYTAEFDMRSHFGKERLDLGICEKLLLYPGNCVKSSLFPNPDGKWHRYSVRLSSGNMGSESWYERPTVQFYFGNASRDGFLDLKNVSLSDGFGNIVHNGDFRMGSDRWFFSSDHYHLPWHEKNLVLHIYFDQGLFGLAAFGMIFVYACMRLLLGAVKGEDLSAALFSAFLGLFAVGLFDSVLDFPRISLLVYLLLFTALMMPKRASA